MLKKITISLFFIYTFLGFLLLPYLFKKEAISYVKQNYDASLEIEDVSFNPFSFELKLKDVKLSKDGKKIIGFYVLNANFEPLGLLSSSIHFKNISLVKPYAYFELLENGSTNFDFLILDDTNEAKKDTKQSDMPRIVLDGLRVSSGSLRFRDDSKDYENLLSPIDIKLAQIDTKLLDYKSAKARVAVGFLDGGELLSSANISSYEPLKLDGSMTLEGFRTYGLYRYIKDELKFELSSGIVDASANFMVDSSDIDKLKIDHAYLRLSELKARDRVSQNDFLTLGSISLSDIEALPLQNSVQIGAIKLDRFNIEATRVGSETIDLLKYMPSSATKDEQKDAQDEMPPSWSVKVAKIDLSKISATFIDKFVKPSVSTKLNELNLSIEDVSYPQKTSFDYAFDLKANGSFRCDSSGIFDYDKIKLNSQIDCSGFDVMRYNPYIQSATKENFRKFDIFLKSAIVGFGGKIDFISEPQSIKLQDAKVDVEDFSVATKRSNLASFKSFKASGIELDSTKKSIDISSLKLSSLGVYAQKNKDATLSVDNLVVAKKTSKSKSSTKPYMLNIVNFDVDSSAIFLKDLSQSMVVKADISNIKLNAKHISTQPNKVLDYDLSATLNRSAKIYSKAKLKLDPLELNGRFGIKKLALKELNPYLANSTFIKLDEGLFNLESKLEFKNDMLNASGNLWLDDFYMLDYRDGSIIASFPKLNLKSFEFDQKQNALDVKEVVLDSFYLDAVVEKDKSFSLTKLIKPNEETTQEPPQTSLDEHKKQPPFSYNVSKVDLQNGYISFADYSLPINFKTLMHNLNGVVGTISSKKDEITLLEIDGAVDDYGEASIKGELKSANVKSYLDIALDFKNLDLGAMSGYSAEFAGYKIDDGRLFLGLNYNIVDSMLKSQNRLQIKKIELGEPLEDENITKLPLPLAIMLLENNDRVIDINLPIEGDIDSPDFKYGSVVLKALINLITKALTSPFNLLASAIGLSGNETLDGIVFESGSSTILPQQKEILDKISLMLEQRKNLVIGLAVGYNSEADMLALKSVKLKNRVNSQTTNRRSTITILEDMFLEANSKSQLKSLQNELKKESKGTSYDIAYQKALISECAKLQEVSKEELDELIELRAKVIMSYLNEKKGIDLSKIKQEAPKELEVDKQNSLKTEFVIEL